MGNITLVQRVRDMHVALACHFVYERGAMDAPIEPPATFPPHKTSNQQYIN
jgi:hypothetical protein